jgi:hypothetical protein
MMIEKEPPDESVVRASVERIEVDVLAGIRTNRVRKRRLTVGLAILSGVALFAGGIAVGGAAFAPVRTRGFSASCFEPDSNGPSSVRVFFTKAEASDPRTAISDAEHSCIYDRKPQQEMFAVNEEISKRQAAGDRCGLVKVTGGETWSFMKYGTGWESSDGTPVPRLPAGCRTTTISLPPLPPYSPVVCRVSDSAVSIYPRGTSTAAQVCAKQGYTVWTD